MSNPLKKTMVMLGLSDEPQYSEPETEPEAHAAAPAAAQSTAQTQQVPRAAVTPLRRATPKPAPAAPLSEILTVHPRYYNDAPVIAENFRDGIPVIINLSKMEDGEAQRLIDFASGLSQGLYGKIERITSKVFLLSPAHIALSGEGSGNDTGDQSFFVKP